MEDLSVPCGSMTKPMWRITGGSLETVLFVPYGAEIKFDQVKKEYISFGVGSFKVDPIYQDPIL